MGMFKYLKFESPNLRYIKDTTGLTPEMVLFEETLNFYAEEFSLLPTKVDIDKLKTLLGANVDLTNAKIEELNKNTSRSRKLNLELAEQEIRLKKLKAKLDLVEKRYLKGTLHFFGHKPWRVLNMNLKVEAIRLLLKQTPATDAASIT